ncbi:MAG TPA: hypothetical protein VG028_13465 [Terriglobia bacterium]|nr:hypothetical protein [Terriglobia bacterium]
MIEPGPILSAGPQGSWLERLRQWVRANRLLPGNGYRIKRYPEGIALEILGPTGGGATGAGMYHLKSVQGDYLTCRTWDGTNEGEVDIYVAKPYKLRNSLVSVTELGVVYNLTYAALDANNVARTKAGGGNSETEWVIPMWVPNDIIYSIAALTGVADATGKAINLLMIGEAREWAAQ